MAQISQIGKGAEGAGDLLPGSVKSNFFFNLCNLCNLWLGIIFSARVRNRVESFQRGLISLLLSAGRDAPALRQARRPPLRGGEGAVSPQRVVVNGLETVTNAISGTRMFYRLMQ
jgi:hypothetical protein